LAEFVKYLEGMNAHSLKMQIDVDRSYFLCKEIFINIQILKLYQYTV